ncbi:MAG: PspC domain-containing protein [Bacteroidales bacterium]|nr:PspC domain-containing protein [Bacteroidales bacterium]
MKPVENVSIGGCVFSLEEDACAVARKYLDELNEFYSKRESGAEIMEGIEERMSELLLEQSGTGGVVTLAMVERAMSTLGKPEAIEEESGDYSGEASNEPSGAANPVRRKLYRDPSTGKVAGVCSGLGAYFKVDPTLFRLIFTVLSLIGLGLFFHRGWLHLPDYFFPLIYAVLWICMPVAKTVSQRDELRGEKGTVDAISARVLSSVQEMGEAAESVVKSDFWTGIWRILQVCMGIILLVAGVAGVVALGCLVFDGSFFSNTFFLNRVMEDIANDAPRVFDMLSYPPLVFALAVAVVVPFVGMVYGGIMLLFDLKAPKWHPGLCMFVIWLIALTVLAALSAMILFKGL